MTPLDYVFLFFLFFFFSLLSLLEILLFQQHRFGIGSLPLFLAQTPALLPPMRTL